MALPPGSVARIRIALAKARASRAERRKKFTPNKEREKANMEHLDACFAEVTKKVEDWEKEFRKGVGDDNWHPIWEILEAEIEKGGHEDDGEINMALEGNRILLLFEKATGVCFWTLIQWYRAIKAAQIPYPPK